MNSRSRAGRHSGFTIIEVIAGIIVLAIALLGFSVAFGPQAARSVDTIYQVRATELGSSLLNEIISLSFDQANNRAGGSVRCGAVAPNACTADIDFGPEPGENRDDYNDVDDFDEFSATGELLTGTTISELYKNFTVLVTVCYAETAIAACTTSIEDYKKVQVSVTTPNGQVFSFTSYRGNI